MLLNYADNVQDYIPPGLLRTLLVMLAVYHCNVGSAQISRVISMEEDPDNIYFIEEVPLPSTLQGFNAISIFQDRDGFMWFGGESGLLRYDGSRIRTYRFDPNDKASLRLNRINVIAQDSSGMIWLGTLVGLIRLDPVSNTFKRYLNTGLQEQQWDWNLIYDFIMDGHRIWMGTGKGFCMFDIRSGQYSSHHKLYNPLASGQDNWTTSISERVADSLFFRFGNHLFNYNISNDSLHPVRGSIPSHAKTYKDQKGELLFPSWAGLYRYSTENHNFEEIKLDLEQYGIQPWAIRSLIQGPKKYYWVSTDAGIGQFTENWQPQKFWEYDPAKKSGVNFDQYRAMYIDRSGTIWFSTPGSINRIIVKPEVFHCTRPPMQEFMVYFSVNDSCYWFSDLYGNLYRVHHDRSIVKQYNLTAVDELQTILPLIVFFLFDRSGTLWIGTDNAGIYRCDNIFSSDPVFTHPFPGTGKYPDIRGSQIHTIYEDSIGRVWFGIEHHWPSYIDSENGKLVHIQFDRVIDWFPREVKVEAELGNDVFLASTRTGAVLFNMKDIQMHDDTLHIMNHEKYTFRNQGTDRNIYPHQILQTRDSSGQIQLYVISDQGGIHRYKYQPLEPKGERIVKDLEVNTNSGLITNAFSNIVEDKNGILWFGSEDGLVRYDPVFESFTTYTNNQGLKYDEFQLRSVVKGPDDRLFYGTDFGLLSFHPDSIILNKTVPPVFVTDVKVNGTSILEDSLASVSFFNHNKFRFNYKENNITFEFAALNYVHPERNHFKIRLEGYDNAWMPVGNESMYSYFNLRPGTYKFDVIGSNNDDVWNMTGDRFEFMVKRPPWFTWGALLIYLLILSAIAIIYYRYVQYRAKHRVEIERERIEKESIAEVDEMKSRFFANISHEFRTPLTLIMSHVRDLERQQGDELKLKRRSLEMLGRNARRLLLLINQLLDIAKLEKNALQLDLQKGDLSEWMRTLVSSFQSLADSQQIRFNSSIEDPGRMVCFDPDKLEKIVTNLLSNAFKFTKKGGSIVFKLNYFFTQEQDQEYVEIKVHDTGRGMDKEQLSRIFDRFYQGSFSDTRDAEGSGIGLSLTRELVELMRGTINVESIPGEGTRFMVTIPVSEKCFPGEQVSLVNTAEVIYASTMQGEQMVDEVVDEAENENRGQGDKIILVVEDNPDLRKYIIEQFSGSYQVLAASQGKQGLEEARKYLPDLVISDLMMPVMGGMEMTQQLKSDPLTNHIPVIMLTAKADKTSKIEGLETGADDYIIKPFDSEELIVRAGNLIRQREQLRNKFTRDYLVEKNKKGSFIQYKMLKEILEVIDHHLEDPEFNLASFGKDLGMTRSQLFRKIHSIAGTTPNELLKIVRMKRAAYLFRTTDMNVAQVTYEVGMKNPSHFAKSFKKYLGVNPAKYRKQA